MFFRPQQRDPVDPLNPTIPPPSVTRIRCEKTASDASRPPIRRPASHTSDTAGVHVPPPANVACRFRASTALVTQGNPGIRRRRIADRRKFASDAIGGAWNSGTADIGENDHGSVGVRVLTRFS
ncbi:hypothetical protein J2X68_001172 [Streptomyces sp. 3330]|nr:hypothetical protein [Streptomyces sp. 3330]